MIIDGTLLVVKIFKLNQHSLIRPHIEGMTSELIKYHALVKSESIKPLDQRKDAKGKIAKKKKLSHTGLEPAKARNCQKEKSCPTRGSNPSRGLCGRVGPPRTNASVRVAWANCERGQSR